VTLLTDETVRITAPRARIWSVFDDAETLRRVLPGCEALEASGPGAFRGVLATKLQFLTLRADVTATLAGVERPDRLRLELDGRPRGLAGAFRAVIPIDLAEDGAETLVHYRVDLTTSGRLASFGAPLMRDTMKRQVATLIRNLETELSGGASAADGSSA
jgi:uncharacterized protein